MSLNLNSSYKFEFNIICNINEDMIKYYVINKF